MHKTRLTALLLACLMMLSLLPVHALELEEETVLAPESETELLEEEVILPEEEEEIVPEEEVILPEEEEETIPQEEPLLEESSTALTDLPQVGDTVGGGTILEISPEFIFIENPLYDDLPASNEFCSGDDLEEVCCAVLTEGAVEYIPLEQAAVQLRESFITQPRTHVDPAKNKYDEWVSLHTLHFITDYQATGSDEDKIKGNAARKVVSLALEETEKGSQGDYIRANYRGYNVGEFVMKDNGDGSYSYDFVIEMHWYSSLAMEATLNSALDTLLPTLKKTSDLETVRAVYDYICSNVSYDYTNLDNKYYLKKYTAYGALIDKKAVCQGYAMLFYRMTKDLGIDCRLIAGLGGSVKHAWNIVELDGKYYNLDSTWDAGKSFYQYFLRCPAEFYDHTRYSTVITPWLDYESESFHQAYPMADKDYLLTECHMSDMTIEAMGTTAALDWSPCPDAVKYAVYRRRGSSAWGVLGFETQNSVLDDSGTVGVTYEYRVEGIHADGTFCRMDFGSLSLLHTPEIVGIGGGYDGIQLIWNRVSNADKYLIYRSGEDDLEPQKILEVTDRDRCVDLPAESGTYTYMVFAANDRSVSNPSADVSYTYQTLDKAVQGSMYHSGIQLSWSADESAESYIIYQGEEGSPLVELAEVSECSYQDLGLVSGHSYRYIVIGVGKDYTSVYRQLEMTYQAPTEVTALTNTNQGVQVKWDAVPGAVGYQISRKIGDGIKEIAADLGADQTVWTDTGLQSESGKLIEYTVIVKEQQGTQSESQGRTICYMASPVFSVASGKEGPQITLTPVAGAAAYDIYRKTDTTNFRKIETVDGSVTLWKDTAVKAQSGTKFTYAVRAKHESGAQSYYYTAAVNYMATPTFKTSNQNAGIRVEWTGVNGADEYWIYRKTGTGSFARATAVSGSTSSWVDTSVKDRSGTQYTYAVRAKHQSGTLSQYYSSTILRMTTPTFKTSNQNAGIRVEWTKVEGAAEYWIYRKTGNGSFARATAVSGSTTSWVDTSVKDRSNTQYTYAVRAKHQNGTLSQYYSSTILRMTTPTFRLSNQTAGIRVEWTGVNGAAEYWIYRKTDTTGFTRVAAVSGSTSSWIDAAVKDRKGTRYTYAVRAKHQSGALSGYYQASGVRR